MQRARVGDPQILGRVARRRHDDLHRRHPGKHHVLHLVVWTPRPVAVASKHNARARRIEPRQVARLNSEKGLRRRPIGVGCFELRELLGRKAGPQPAQVHLHAPVRQVRREDHVRTLLEHRHQLVVDILVANSVRERVDSGADEPLRVLEIEEVRGDPQAPLVRLVDDGAVHFRSQLLVLAVPVVDPDLDDVDLVRRGLLHRLAAFRHGGNPVRRGRTPRLGRRDPAPGAEIPRGAGYRLAADIEHVVVVGAHAQRGTHAVVGAHFQVPHDRIARGAEMDVRVDDHRHHGLAREVHAGGTSGHADVRGLARLSDLRAVHHQRRVLDHASVTYD